MATHLGDEIDPVTEKLREKFDSISRKTRLWAEVKAKALPFVKEMVLLGCDLRVDDNDVNFTLSGDKEKFLRLVRIHRKYGFKPDMPKKGDTSASWFIYVDTWSFWVYFTSTVCKRVKVGTEMKAVDKYETVCEEFVPSAEELAATAPPELLSGTNTSPVELV